MEENRESFEYTYSAKRQEEIDRIRKKYMPQEDGKMDLLRKLDRDVTKPGIIWGLVIGIIGCMLFGIGMCCTLVWAEEFFVLGIVIGIIGMIIMGTAYPIYVRITAKQRKKLAPQILALTEKLSK